MKTIRVGIVGAGLIGGKRAEAIVSTGKGKLVAVADPDAKRAEALARKYGAEAYSDWKKLVVRKDIDVVIVAVPNAFAASVVLAALKHGKHVLVEKPFGINTKESLAMLAAAKKAKRLVKVGFNHRFYASILKAREIFEKGGIGKVLFIRSRYGHGGRRGMEKEWRSDKKISGGGELLDQGVHIIDLARWFAGDFKSVYGLAETKFWNTNLDDNTFVLMENGDATVSFHVSTTNWRNIFSFEVFGDKGFLDIGGKGGSYGKEVLTYGKCRPELGAPDIKVFTFAAKEASWDREWENFVSAIGGRRKISGDGKDGLAANELVEAIYRSSREGKPIRL
jgi:predicted dehydrogenase